MEAELCHKLFLHLLKWSGAFHSVNGHYHTDRFAYVQPTLHHRYKSHLVMAYTYYYYYFWCVVDFGLLILRSFASVFIRDIISLFFFSWYHCLALDQGNVDLKEWISTCYILFNFLEEFFVDPEGSKRQSHQLSELGELGPSPSGGSCTSWDARYVDQLFLGRSWRFDFITGVRREEKVQEVPTLPFRLLEDY